MNGPSEQWLRLHDESRVKRAEDFVFEYFGLEIDVLEGCCEYVYFLYSLPLLCATPLLCVGQEDTCIKSIS
jgi:hypothetical protein